MIDLGSLMQIAVDVRDADGELTNPSTAVLTVMLPDGTSVTPSVTLPPDVTGEVRVDYPTTQAGRHVWRLVTTAPATAYADVFDATATASGIVSLARTRAQLNFAAAETADDDELRGYIAAATGAVERQLGKAVARRTVTDRLTPDRYGQILLRTVPVLELTTVQSPDGATTWDTDDLQVDTQTGLVTVAAGASLGSTVDVTYQAGMSIVPEDYQLAALIIVQHLWETQRGAMGVQLGGEAETYVPGKGFAIPRRAIELLDSTLPGVA